MIRVTIWNEYERERSRPEVARIYPAGIHGAIAEGIQDDELAIRTATFDELEHGLTAQVLAETDVLIYWGHALHDEFQDAVVERICRRVHEGMGLIVLHSGHHSKLFRRLMGTSCDLLWREADEKERLWVVDPSHPIVEGIGPYFDLPQEEMYGEHFDIPVPDELIFVSWFAGEKCSAAAVRTDGGKVAFSIFGRAMRRIRLTTIRTCGASSPTPFAGQLRSNGRRRTTATTSRLNGCNNN